jgi:diguanylate cyclase (GGDEF)-like protein
LVARNLLLKLSKNVIVDLVQWEVFVLAHIYLLKFPGHLSMSSPQPRPKTDNTTDFSPHQLGAEERSVEYGRDALPFGHRNASVASRRVAHRFWPEGQNLETSRSRAPLSRKSPFYRSAAWAGLSLRWRGLPGWLLDNLHEPDARALSGSAPTEADREPLFRLELLRVFQQRIRLVAVLCLLLLPLTTAFYHYSWPSLTPALLRCHCLMFAALLGICALTPGLATLRQAKLLSYLSFGVYCAGIGFVITLVSNEPSMSSWAMQSVGFIILATYIQVLLSVLLLPYSGREALTVIGLLVATVVTGLQLSVTGQESTPFGAQLFVIATTAVIVLGLCVLHNVLRRRAFDASFDLASQASLMQAASSADALTGGYNRRYAESVLTGELSRAARFGHPMSLILFDMDNFKPVNDTLGVAAGDEVLREIHRTASTTLREVDTLARFGGDEFLVILPETSGDAVRILADRLRQATRSALVQRFGSSSRQANVTLSIGILTVYGQQCSVASALSRVDELLYEAKRSGKNQTVASQRARSGQI